MVELKEKYFSDVSLKDLRTAIGAAILCRLSARLLSRAAKRSRNFQLIRKLSETAQQREQISEQLIPKEELSKPVIENVIEAFSEEAAAYGKLENHLHSDRENPIDEAWVEGFHQADQEVLRSLRSATWKVEEQSLATQLSSLIASYRLSSERLHRNYIGEFC
ncbi:MAG: hypothetical protein RL839_13810 [Gammaproteobacteria bacterium]